MLDHEPLNAVDAKKLIREILENGKVRFTAHALRELEKDGCSVADATNVLRGGVVDEAEWENGEWRHRVHTSRMCVVASFDSKTKLVVVTGWKYGTRR